MKNMSHHFDRHVVARLRKYEWLFARTALFVIFFWFGALKIIGLSPAHDLAVALIQVLIPAFPPELFVLLVGIFEVVIGLLFLFRRIERVAIVLLLIHMVGTILPLIFLQHMTWQQAFVPTMEGQYIIKNLAIVMLGVGILAHLKPNGQK